MNNLSQSMMNRTLVPFAYVSHLDVKLRVVFHKVIIISKKLCPMKTVWSRVDGPVESGSSNFNGVENLNIRKLQVRNAH